MDRISAAVLLFVSSGAILLITLPYYLSTDYEIARQMKKLECSVDNNTLIREYSIGENMWRDYFINVTLTNNISQNGQVSIPQIDWNDYLALYNKNQTICNYNPTSPIRFYVFPPSEISNFAIIGFVLGSVVLATCFPTAIIIIFAGQRNRHELTKQNEEIFGN